MATTAYFLNQYITTTLNVGGGINNSQTTGIIIASVSGLDITKPGIALANYADPLNTNIAEWITYTSINGSNELQGVTRGAEGFSAKAHSNGVSIAFPISESHINNLATGLLIGGSATNMVEGFLDEDTLASDSATKGATQQSIKAYVDARASTDGWISKTSETWTRTGNHTFTIATDLTSVYQKGTKIRYKDGGSYEYGYVESSSYSAPNTTVTLVTNNDYAMASATITDNYISYLENPQGFPEWFSFTTTWGGFSANPSTTTIYFKLSGKLCSGFYIDGSDGTSNSTSTTFTMPVAAARSLNNAGFIGIKDSGSISSTPGHLLTTASSKTITAYKSFSQTAWTNSGAKNLYMPLISFEWT